MTKKFFESVNNEIFCPTLYIINKIIDRRSFDFRRSD